MSYEHEQFLTTVAQKARGVADRAGTDEDAARRAIDCSRRSASSCRAARPTTSSGSFPTSSPTRCSGDALSNGAARRMSLEEFVRRVAEREGVTPDEAHAQARAVFAMLRETLPEREFDDVLAQLPRDYAALTARP
jgi:hypothetical protein